jgi:hypothetical protein
MSERRGDGTGDGSTNQNFSIAGWYDGAVSNSITVEFDFIVRTIASKGNGIDIRNGGSLICGLSWKTGFMDFTSFKDFFASNENRAMEGEGGAQHEPSGSIGTKYHCTIEWRDDGAPSGADPQSQYRCWTTLVLDPDGTPITLLEVGQNGFTESPVKNATLPTDLQIGLGPDNSPAGVEIDNVVITTSGGTAGVDDWLTMD